MDISPPLLNSANPWATTLDDLKALFECPHTGAVTTRTALLGGFAHDGEKHRFVLFDAKGYGGVSQSSERERVDAMGEGKEDGKGGAADGEMVRMNASLNTLGYSYYMLDEYLGFIERIVAEARENRSREGHGKVKRKKWFIVSVTGTPDHVADCYRRILTTQKQLDVSSGGEGEGEGEGGATVVVKLAMEVNLSCPNIPDKPPPAYSGDALREYISAISEVMAEGRGVDVPWGVKTPPYTFAGQFEQLMTALQVEGPGGKSSVTFVTATNTLGSCLVLSSKTSEEGSWHTPALPGYGIGGMAGAPLHPLALGNVATLRRMLDEHRSTRHIGVIGIGGVEDAAGYRRMRDVGAFAVGVGTALGAKGVKVFEEIEQGLGGRW